MASQSVVGFFDIANGDLPNIQTRTTVYSVAWSPDGSKIAEGELDGTIEIWNVASRQLITTVQGHTGLVSQLIFTADGTKLASVSADGTARIWNTANWVLLNTITIDPSVTALAWKPDGNQLAVARTDNTVSLISGQIPTSIPTLTATSTFAPTSIPTVTAIATTTVLDRVANLIAI